MKTAKEMFEELGYIELDNRNYQHLIMYQRETPQHIQRITFDTKSNKYYCATLDDTFIKNGLRMQNKPMHIDVKHNKAIQKQIEELGWDNEKR